MPISTLPSLMTSTQIPGMSVATVTAGVASEHWALGMADKGKGSVVTDQTLFDAASLSKPLFAYLVLTLVAEGILSLDQPLCELTDTTIGDNSDYANLLTARLILSHKTGLPNWAKQNEIPTFAFKPGTGYSYSGEAYVYLQKIIEAKTDKSLEVLAQEKVFGPLFMTHSHFDWPSKHANNIAIPHDAMMLAQPLPIGRPANAAASLWTTAEDYAKFIEAWLNNNEPKLRALLDEALIPKVWMTQDPKVADKLNAEVLSHVGWGIGWGLNKTKDGDLIAFQYGDNGNAKSFAAINLTTRAAMVYFANSVNGLAIAQQAVAATVGDVSHAIQYLGYETYGEHWQARHEALKAGQIVEAKGEYARAIQQFQQALKFYPTDKVTTRRIQWLDELIQNQSIPFTPKKPLEFYVGHYGRAEMPIEITLEQNQLSLNVAGEKLTITPISDNYFAIGTDSRIQFNCDAQGRLTELHSVFLSGGEDVSPRISPLTRTIDPNLLDKSRALLEKQFGTDVAIASYDVLSEPTRRNVILRIHLTSASEIAPKSVILKQSLPTNDQDKETAARFARDWAGLAFSNQLQPDTHHVPQFYGADKDSHFILIEDLGEKHVSLVDSLLASSEEQAVSALERYMTALGRFHAASFGHTDTYQQTLATIYEKSTTPEQDLAACREEWQKGFAKRDLAITPELDSEIENVLAGAYLPGPFTVLVHGDIAPDNVFDHKDAQELQLLDFEWSFVRNALLDGTYLRMYIPTGWCAKAIPEQVLEPLEQRYRAELQKTIPAAADDQAYDTAYTQACAFHALQELAHMHHVMEKDSNWGPLLDNNSGRSRVLSRLQAFIEVAEKHAQLPHLKCLAEQTLTTLKALWPEAKPLAYYPAFTPTLSHNRHDPVRETSTNASTQVDYPRAMQNNMMTPPVSAVNKAQGSTALSVTHLSLREPVVIASTNSKKMAK